MKEATFHRRAACPSCGHHKPHDAGDGGSRCRVEGCSCTFAPAPESEPKVTLANAADALQKVFDDDIRPELERSRAEIAERLNRAPEERSVETCDKYRCDKALPLTPPADSRSEGTEERAKLHREMEAALERENDRATERFDKARGTSADQEDEDEDDDDLRDLCNAVFRIGFDRTAEHVRQHAERIIAKMDSSSADRSEGAGIDAAVAEIEDAELLLSGCGCGYKTCSDCSGARSGLRAILTRRFLPAPASADRCKCGSPTWQPSDTPEVRVQHAPTGCQFVAADRET